MFFRRVWKYTRYRNIGNYTQISENLRNALVGFFGLRNEFVNVQENKKHNTQNNQVKKQQKKSPFELIFVDQKGLRVDYRAMAKGH